jgi:hypothetical protein
MAQQQQIKEENYQMKKRKGRKPVTVESKFSYDSRIYVKTVGIFSSLLDVKINVQFVESGLCKVAKTDENEYLVSLNPYKSYIRTQKQFFRVLEHELAHLLFKSDINIIQKFARKMAKKYGQYGIQEHQAKLTMFAIEDHRIEANWAYIYLGSMKYFKEIKSGAINQPPMDLALLTLAARCEAKYLIHPFFNKFYEFTLSKLQETEGKTMVASVKVGDQIIQEYIETVKDFLQQKKDSKTDSSVDDGFFPEDDKQKGFEGSEELSDQSVDYDPVEDISIDELESILDEYSEDGDISTEEIREEVFRRFCEESGGYKEETSLDLDLDIDINQVLSGEFESVMEDSRREFDSQIQVIKEKLAEFAPPSPTRNIELPVVEENHFKMEDPPARPFYGVVERLKQTFRKIELQNEIEEYVSEQGLFDNDLFIQGMLSRQPDEMFVDEEEKEGIILILLIDGSGSMADGSLETAKRVGLTMYETAKNYDQIEVFCWIFAGERDYTPIQELNELKLARVKWSGWTHTNDAVRFVTQQPQYQGKKCVLFIATDGCPMSGNVKYKKHVKEHKGKFITWIQADTHFAINEARDRGWKIFTFFIGDPIGNSGIFGQPFVSLKTGGELIEVLDHFEREVAKHLKK